MFTTTDERSRARALPSGRSIARGVNFARDLVNGPGYAMTPAKLGEEAVTLGQRLGLKVTVLDKAQLIEQGFGGILAVGKGSAQRAALHRDGVRRSRAKARRRSAWSARG